MVVTFEIIYVTCLEGCINTSLSHTYSIWFFKNSVIMQNLVKLQNIFHVQITNYKHTQSYLNNTSYYLTPLGAPIKTFKYFFNQ